MASRDVLPQPLTMDSPTPASIPLSVVVPTHGRIALFSATLESLRRQECDSFELVVTDDSRSPHDRETIRSAVDEYIRQTGRPARYVFTEPGLGQAANTNQGLRAARGDLLRILHSDDLLHPGCLAWEIAQFHERAPLSVLFQDCIQFHQVEEIRWTSPPGFRLIDPAAYFRTHLSRCTALPSGMVFSRAAFAAVGAMRERWHFLCDWEFFSRLLLWAADQRELVCHATRGHCAWRMHDDSTSGHRWQDHYLEHAALMREWDDALSSRERVVFADRNDRRRFFVEGRTYRVHRLVADCSCLNWIRFVKSMPWLGRNISTADWLAMAKLGIQRPLSWLRRKWRSSSGSIPSAPEPPL